MKLWNDLCGWAATNAAALRLCFRMTVAGLLAYVLAELFALPQGYEDDVCDHSIVDEKAVSSSGSNEDRRQDLNGLLPRLSPRGIGGAKCGHKRADPAGEARNGSFGSFSEDAP